MRRRRPDLYRSILDHLEDCLRHLGDDNLSPEERVAREELLIICWNLLAEERLLLRKAKA